MINEKQKKIGPFVKKKSIKRCLNLDLICQKINNYLN